MFRVVRNRFVDGIYTEIEDGGMLLVVNFLPVFRVQHTCDNAASTEAAAFGF